MATKLRSGPVRPSGSRSDHRHPQRSQPGRQGVDLPKSVHGGETNKQAETFTARNRAGWTPLHIAAGVFRQGTYKESPAIAELLRAAMRARGLPVTLAAPAR